MFSRHNTPEIGTEELDDLATAGAVYVLDVREDWEYKRGRVPGAISIPLGQLMAKVAGLPKDKPYAVICESGSRSQSATDYLLSQGFEGAVSVKGGTGAWARSNRPIERD
jgi:RND superfamily putative drug exporter